MNKKEMTQNWSKLNPNLLFAQPSSFLHSHIPKQENGPSHEVVLLLPLVSTFSIFQILFAQGAPTTLIPAIITFGNSVVNVGKNNYLSALLRAEYPTYGREFANLKSTARFCKGKLVTDITSTSFYL